MAKEILGYAVYSTANGGVWLADDEKTWTPRFVEAAEFGNVDLATDIGARENPDGKMDTIYVFATMGS